MPSPPTRATGLKRLISKSSRATGHWLKRQKIRSTLRKELRAYRSQEFLSEAAAKALSRGAGYENRFDKYFGPLDREVMRMKNDNALRLEKLPAASRERLRPRFISSLKNEYREKYMAVARRAAVAHAARHASIGRVPRAVLVKLAADGVRSDEMLSRAKGIMGKKEYRDFSKAYEEYGRPIFIAALARINSV